MSIPCKPDRMSSSSSSRTNSSLEILYTSKKKKLEVWPPSFPVSHLLPPLELWERLILELSRLRNAQLRIVLPAHHNLAYRPVDQRKNRLQMGLQQHQRQRRPHRLDSLPHQRYRMGEVCLGRCLLTTQSGSTRSHCQFFFHPSCPHLNEYKLYIYIYVFSMR